MSAVANLVESSARHDQTSLGHDLVLALATADDVASGMANVVEVLRRDSGAARVEWWARGDDGAVECVAAAGSARGTRENLPLGPAASSFSMAAASIRRSSRR